MSKKHKKINKQELIDKLHNLKESGDHEGAHGDADEALLDYIHDDEVTEAFDDIEKWYA